MKEELYEEGLDLCNFSANAFGNKSVRVRSDTLESKVKQILLREADPEKLYKRFYEIGNLGDEQETTAILLKLAKVHRHSEPGSIEYIGQRKTIKMVACTEVAALPQPKR